MNLQERLLSFLGKPAECATSSSSSTSSAASSADANSLITGKDRIVVSNDEASMDKTDSKVEVEVVRDVVPPATETGKKVDETKDSANVVKYETPAQDKLEREIKDLHDKIDQLESFKNTGFATTENLEELKRSRQLLNEKKTKLRRKVGDAKRSREARKRKSDTLKNFVAENPENAEKLSRLHMIKLDVPLWKTRFRIYTKSSLP